MEKTFTARHGDAETQAWGQAFRLAWRSERGHKREAPPISEGLSFVTSLRSPMPPEAAPRPHPPWNPMVSMLKTTWLHVYC